MASQIKHGFCMHDQVEISGLLKKYKSIVTGFGPEDYIRVRTYVLPSNIFSDWYKPDQLKLIKESYRRPAKRA